MLPLEDGGLDGLALCPEPAKGPALSPSTSLGINSAEGRRGVGGSVQGETGSSQQKSYDGDSEDDEDARSKPVPCFFRFHCCESQ